MKIAAALVTIVIQFPIWFYLVYTILDSIQVSSLTWFLFWVYAPATVFGHILIQLTKEDK